jgi:muramoyltetrapeptide carboxypeptidase
MTSSQIIDVISPASSSVRPWNDETLAQYVPKNLQLRVHAQVGQHPFHAGSDESRFEILKKSLTAPDSKVIWCRRGGYGAIRLLPFLAKMRKPKQQKLLVGYSDITSLHSFFTQVWGWPTLHGPVLDSLLNQNFSSVDKRQIIKAVTGELPDILSHKVRPMNSVAKALGAKQKISGSLCGGNLATLASQCGTPYQLKAKGRIVVLEDVSERGYKLDRYLTQLLLSQSFKGAQAIIFGDFTDGLEADGRDLTKFSLKRFAASTSIPVFSHLKMGHGHRNSPFFFNTPTVLQNGLLSNCTYRF